jgi:ribonuclease HI
LPIAENDRITETDRLAPEVGRRRLPVGRSRAIDRELARILRRSLAAEPKPIMPVQSPHFLLYAEASVGGHSRPRWKFVLQSIGGDDRLTAADIEPETRPSRLELLAVVRGLEALDQPSRVTLLTRSRYVRRGLRRELGHWRERRWSWERFGKLVPIRDHDLWQRVDRALEFHQVECCAWHGDDSLGAMPTAWRGHVASPGHGHSEQRPWHPSSDSAPALLLVERRRPHRRRRWSLSGTLNRLRQGVFTPFSAIWRPAFTRAA